MSRARSKPPRQYQPGRVILAFFALSDLTRYELLLRIAELGPVSITQLAEGAAISRQSIRKHLGVLEEAQLVRGQLSGRKHLWEYNPPGIDGAQQMLAGISGQWDAAIARLREHLGE